MTGPLADAAELRRQWEDAVDRAWDALNAAQAKEAMDEADALWDQIVGQTPKAGDEAPGPRPLGKGIDHDPPGW